MSKQKRPMERMLAHVASFGNKIISEIQLYRLGLLRPPINWDRLQQPCLKGPVNCIVIPTRPRNRTTSQWVTSLKCPPRKAHLLHGLAPVHISPRTASMGLSRAWQLGPLTSLCTRRSHAVVCSVANNGHVIWYAVGWYLRWRRTAAASDTKQY